MLGLYEMRPYRQLKCRHPIGMATEGISHPLYMYVQAVRALASMQEPPSLHFPAKAAYAPYRCLSTVAAGMHLR